TLFPSVCLFIFYHPTHADLYTLSHTTLFRSLVNPLVVVARPCHDVSPPLMCHFVIRNQLGVVLLSGRAQSRALLGFGRQKGVRGNIEQTGPTLPKGSGYLRDAEVVEGKGAAECFVKTDRGIDLFA